MRRNSPEISARRSSLRLFRRIAAVGLTVIALLIIVGAAGLYLVYEHVVGPGVAGEEVRFNVAEGLSGRDVARRLAEAGIVEHEIFFRLAIRLDGSGQTIKHGTYSLARGLSAMQLLDRLHDGPAWGVDPDTLPEELKITVPEGLTLAQTAEYFDDPIAFVEAASHPALIEGLGIDAPTLEGFLMPNTYYFSTPPSELEVVERMTQQFETEYAALLKEHPGGRHIEKLELVTIASLIEEEARVDEERPLVAAVVYNRLARNMALEMDSTLQFALGKYGRRLLSEDKEVDSPYNTYKRRDLPPGPISSPGVASLRAALAPADVDYLYFVSNADGKTHTFSSTLREHNEAVSRYRREAARQRREREEQAN